MSLDYGTESPLGVDQINFNSLKDRGFSGEEKIESKSSEPTTGVTGPLSFQEAVGKASDSVCCLFCMDESISFHQLQGRVGAEFNLADMLNVAT